jgi:transcriptional antiterminator RfaH
VTQNGGALSTSIPDGAPVSLPNLVPGLLTPCPSWFAVQTRPRHEKKVSLRLREQGIENFLPLHRERRQWSDRQQWIESPLFSHYAFVRIPASSDARVRVLRTSGVVRFAGAPGWGTALPDEQIENLQAIVAQRIPLVPLDFINVGERVRIRGGALNGMEGILTAVKNHRSLIVSVDLIQKSVAIRIDGFEVERA